MTLSPDLRKIAENLVEGGNSFRNEMGCCGGDVCEKGHNRQLIEAVLDALASVRELTWKEAIKSMPEKRVEYIEYGWMTPVKSQHLCDGWNAARTALIEAALKDGVEIE